MINIADITKGVEALLKKKLSGYRIERNAELMNNANMVASHDGWIGIYRKSLHYEPYSTAQLIAQIKVDVVLQVVSMESGEDAEDKLSKSEKKVLDALNSDRTLGGTVQGSSFYDLEYQFNQEAQVWYHASIITITAEVLTSI